MVQAHIWGKPSFPGRRTPCSISTSLPRPESVTFYKQHLVCMSFDDGLCTIFEESGKGSHFAASELRDAGDQVKQIPHYPVCVHAYLFVESAG